jgi:His/Glu/Gln/Arg/opine family amino acid ABC transporter permease subunit
MSFWSDASVWRQFSGGLGLTVFITAVSGCFAIGLGVLGAFIKVAGPAWSARLIGACVEIFRNTPLLIQLFVYYRGLQSVGISLSPLACGILALSLYTGAYLIEVFRAGLNAVPQEQLASARALGLTATQMYRLVWFPQAFRIALPAVGNQLISLAKNSSLLAFITVEELFSVVYRGAVDEFRPLEYFLVGSALYMAVSLLIAGAIRLIERRWLHGPSESPAEFRSVEVS